MKRVGKNLGRSKGGVHSNSYILDAARLNKFRKISLKGKKPGFRGTNFKGNLSESVRKKKRKQLITGWGDKEGKLGVVTKRQDINMTRKPKSSAVIAGRFKKKSGPGLLKKKKEKLLGGTDDRDCVCPWERPFYPGTT